MQGSTRPAKYPHKACVLSSMQDEEESLNYEEPAARGLHPSYTQELADSPPVVVSRFLFRIYAFQLAMLALASVFGIAIKYCMYLLFDEADTDYEMPAAFAWMSLAMLIVTLILQGLAVYFRSSFPANARCLIGVVMFGGYTLGVPAAEIKSRAFLNTIVVLCLVYGAAAILTQQTYFDFRERKVYLYIAAVAAAATAIVNLVHQPTSWGQFLLSVFGSLLMGLPVFYRLWQILPTASSDQDIANAVDGYAWTLGSAIIYFVIGKVAGQTHPL